MYQEEWAEKRRFHDRSHIAFGAFIIGAGFFLAGLVGYAIATGAARDAGMAALMISMVLGLMFFIGFVMVAGELKRMPFRIYEGGFTLPEVSLAKGWRREEEFIPWSRLEKISLEEKLMMGISIRRITLRYDGSKSLDLGYGILDEPFAVMKALHRTFPDKMDEKFRVYLGGDDERKVIRYPLPARRERSWEWLMPVFLQLMIALTLAPAAWLLLTRGKWHTFALLGGFQIIMTLTFFWMLLFINNRAQLELVRAKSQATEAGVAIPRTLVSRLTTELPSVVPYSRIKSIRVVLEPLFFSHEAELETFAGDKLRVPYHVYEFAAGREEFRKEWFEYVNKSPMGPGERLLRRSWPGTLATLLLFCSPMAIGPLLSIDLSGVMRIVQGLLLAAVVLVFLPLLYIALNVLQKRQKLAEGLVATVERITIQGAPAKFGTISREELLAARIGRDLWGIHVELETVGGRIKLAHSAAEKLMLAGYKVEGAEGLTPLASLAPAGEEKKEEPQKAVNAHLEPGRLLAEQDPESIRRIRSKFLTLGAALSATGIAGLAAIFILDLEMILKIYMAVFDLLPLLLGPLFLYSGRSLRPVRVHENGIFFPEVMREGGYIFVPYGRIKGYTELQAPIVGKIVRLQLEGGFYNLPSSIPNFNALFEEMKKKFGKPEWDSADFSLFTEKHYRILEVAVVLICLTLGFGGAALINTFADFWTPRSFVGKLFIFGVPPTLLFLAYAFHFLEFKQRPFPGRLSLKAAAGLVIALLVLFSLGWGINVPDPGRDTIFVAEAPDSWVELNDTLENRTFDFHENIYVGPGEELRIRNSTLNFSMSYPGELRFYVARAGRLEVWNSIIRSNSDEFGLRFSIFGRARLEGSTLTNLYASPRHLNGIGGLEIFSSDVEVVNCSIINNRANGLLVVGCSPTIEDCEISGNGDDGIEMQDASPVIKGCRIANNDYAIIINPYSSPLIDSNTIQGNNHGICVVGASPRIINNTFENNRGWAIKYLDNSRPAISGNVFVSNDAGVVREMALESGLMSCASVLVVAGIVACAAVLARIVKKRKERPALKS